MYNMSRFCDFEILGYFRSIFKYDLWDEMATVDLVGHGRLTKINVFIKRCPWSYQYVTEQRVILYIWIVSKYVSTGGTET